MRRDSNYRRTTLGHLNDRRITYSTNLDNQPISEEDEEKETKTLPKIHVAEIKSLRTSVQLAEVLDPVYETVATVTGDDTLNRTEGDGDSGFIPQLESKDEDYYGFTNASSVSVDCEDWIRCVSSADSSVYNNSLNEDEVQYLENKGNKRKASDILKEHLDRDAEANYEDMDSNSETLPVEDKEIYLRHNAVNDPTYINLSPPENETYLPSGIEAMEENTEELINEIIQIIKKKDNQEIVLNPSLLSPNRKDNDGIIFIDE